MLPEHPHPGLRVRPNVYTGAGVYDEENEKVTLTSFRWEKPYVFVRPKNGKEWRHDNMITNISNRDMDYMYIYDNTWDLVFYGISWGVESNVPVQGLGSLASYNDWEGFHGNNYVDRKDWKWKDGAEAKAAAHLQKHVKEGLLEIPRIAFAHWHHRTNQLGSFDERKLRNPGDRQKLRDYVAANIAGSVDKSKAAATFALELEFELDGKFKKAGNSLTKTLEICGDYIAGKFGVNWYCTGFFSHPIDAPVDHPQRKITEIQDNWVRNARNEVDIRRYGESPSHFTEQNLKPLFKRFPNLASIFHE